MPHGGAVTADDLMVIKLLPADQRPALSNFCPRA
jgi:hypothetical protein